MKFRDQVVLITGASSGIGAALARQFAREGAKLVLVARRRERLDALSAGLAATGTRVLVRAGDVTQRSDLDAAIAAASAHFGRLDVAVANAGFGVVGTVEKLGIEDFRRQFETNVFGVLRSVKEALPELERRRGSIGVVGSVNGYVSIPGWSAYCMSKYAVRSLAESLRLELAPLGVSVTHLAPGFVESEFRRVDNHNRLHEDAADPIPPWLVMPADRAARAMLQAVVLRRAEAVITGHGKLAVGAARHAPALVSGALRLGSGLAERLGKRTLE